MLSQWQDEKGCNRESRRAEDFKVGMVIL